MSDDVQPAGTTRTVLVEDRIRERRIPVVVHEDDTTGRLLRRYVRGNGLPTRTLDDEPIRYRLEDEAGAELSDDRSMALVSGDRITLRSEGASATWGRLSTVVAAIESELGTTARDDATQTLEQRVELVRERLTAEAVNRVGSWGDRHSRRRLRRLADELGLTDALPRDVESIAALVRRHGPLAGQAARVIAPVVLVSTAAVGGGVVAGQLDDDPSAAEIAVEVVDILEEAAEVPGDGGTTDGPGASVDVDLIAAAVAEQLSVADRLSTDDLRALLDGLADALEEADPATAPILGGITANPRTELTAAGGSLWSIAIAFREGLREEAADSGGSADPAGCDVGTSYEEPIGAYVLRVWSANLDVVGADPDAIEVGTVLRMPCPR